MTLIDNNFLAKYPSEVHMARTEKIRVVKLEPGLFYVARRAEGHNRYLVTIHEASNMRVFADCRTVRGAACPSFGCCTHIAAVVLRTLKDAQRMRREAAA